MSDADIVIPSTELGWLNRLVGAVAGPLKVRSEEVAVEMRKGFYAYSLRTHDRCGYLKTLMSRGEQIKIEDFYVAPLLKIGRKFLDHEQFSNRLSTRNRVLVTGTAGLGKSVFLKFLAIRHSSTSNKPLPVFFELRELNDTKLKIEDSIFDAINVPKPFLTKAQFEYGLHEGVISFYLDAFDEINSDLKEQYEKEILKLSVKYPNAQIVVTSRPSPDESIEGWTGFEHASLQPFDLPRIIQLIEKLDEPLTDKIRFLDILKTSLFQTHQSFLSTPLLALIMYLTFQTGTQIPDKLHEFYHRAFEALYYKHDTSKGHYSRQSYTSLQRDDFLKIVAALCAITYFDGQTSLLESDFLTKIDHAKEIESVNCDSVKLLNDLIESICMLQRDGVEVGFTHRSFQEYFTAKFLLASEALDTFAIINRLISRQMFDNVVSMISEMNKEFLEKKWVLKWLDLYYDKTKGIDLTRDLVTYYKRIQYSPGIFWTDSEFKFIIISAADNASAISIILRVLYSDEFNLFRGSNVEPFIENHADSKKIVDYFAARDQLKLTKSTKNRHYPLKWFAEKDAAVFQGTSYERAMVNQHKFLLHLKKKIEEQHKKKGDGFMDLIRKSRPIS